MMAGRDDPGQQSHRDGHGGPDGQNLCLVSTAWSLPGPRAAPAASVCLSCSSASREYGAFRTSAAGLEIAACSTPSG